MTQYVTIVLAVEDMTKFDVEFKSKIHGGKVTAMAKYDALTVADMAYEALKVCIDDGSCDDDEVLNRIDSLMLCNA